MPKKFQTKYFIGQYQDSQEVKDKVFEKIIEWCKKYELYNGESIMQSNNGLIEAAPLISEIVDDIIKFEGDYA